MSFRPTLVPTSFMIFGVVLTVSLGFWQLGRYYEKEEARQEILEGLSGRVLGAQDLQVEPESLMFRKVEVEGTWTEPVALTAGKREFNRPGYFLIQPLALDDERLLLVRRGWVPRDGLDEAMAQIQAEPQRVTLRGQLRRLEGDPSKEPLPVESAFELWPYEAWPAIWGRLPEPKIEAIVLAGEPLLVGEAKDPTRLPVDGYYPYPKAKDSLSYAFQWWTFAIILIIVWGGLSWRRPDRAVRSSDPGADPPSARSES